jgi:hypothetical protein
MHARSAQSRFSFVSGTWVYWNSWGTATGMVPVLGGSCREVVSSAPVSAVRPLYQIMADRFPSLYCDTGNLHQAKAALNV